MAEDRFGRVPLRPRTVSAEDFFGRGPLRERIVSAEDRFGRGPLRQGTAKEQPWSSRGGPGAAMEQPGNTQSPQPAASGKGSYKISTRYLPDIYPITYTITIR